MARTLDSSQRSHSLSPQQCCSFYLSTRRSFISGLHRRYRTRGSAWHPHPTSPSAPACRHRSAAGATAMMHIDPEDRLLPSCVPPRRRERGEGVFSGVSPKTTRERRQLGGASGATGDHGSILHGAMWKAERCFFRLTLITLIVLQLGTSWEMLIKTQSSHG